MREQVPLSDLGAGPDGHVRFDCRTCPRTGKAALAKLQERFGPTEGLVNVLNAIAPKDCPKRKTNPWGSHQCGWRYRDLGL